MDKRRKPAIREPRPHLTMEEMRSYLTSLKEIESVTGIRYIKLHVTAKMIIGIREASGKEFTINLDDLFRAYNECLRFTSPEVKKYIFMGHSPAVALLRRLQNRQPVDTESFHEEEKKWKGAPESLFVKNIKKKILTKVKNKKSALNIKQIALTTLVFWNILVIFATSI